MPFADSEIPLLGYLGKKVNFHESPGKEKVYLKTRDRARKKREALSFPNELEEPMKKEKHCFELRNFTSKKQTSENHA